MASTLNIYGAVSRIVGIFKRTNKTKFMAEVFGSSSIIRNRIAALTEEHRGLDGAVSALIESHKPDELHLKRMKKRKLLLKDEILRLQKMLVTDVPA
tara:strand:+ start:97 stop:387 length:291 start_codon:yes stop_codon:yes gene_type:complete